MSCQSPISLFSFKWTSFQEEMKVTLMFWGLSDSHPERQGLLRGDKPRCLPEKADIISIQKPTVWLSSLPHDGNRTHRSASSQLFRWPTSHLSLLQSNRILHSAGNSCYLLDAPGSKRSLSPPACSCASSAVPFSLHSVQCSSSVKPWTPFHLDLWSFLQH